MELHVEKQVIELLQNLTKKFDKLEGRFDGLEGRFDGLEGRFDKLESKVDGLESKVDKSEGRFDKLEAGQQEIVNELRDFRSETGQNFATLVENDRNLRIEIKTLEQKQDMEIGHLNLKTDALQSEVLRLKRS